MTSIESLTRPAPTCIEFVTLEVADPTAANRFYTAALGLGTELGLCASEAPTTGYRGFTLSLAVAPPVPDRGRMSRCQEPLFTYAW